MSGYDPLAGLHDGHDPQTPPGAEAALGNLADQLDDARAVLTQKRNEEVAAKHLLDKTRRAKRFSPECPVAAGPGRTCTVADREAWIEEETADLALRHELATVARKAAQEHLKTLGQQLSAQQSISRSVGNDFAGTRGTWG